MMRPIPDDQPIPDDVLALAMRMAQQKLPPSNQTISDATGISVDRLVRMRVSGSLTYTGKRSSNSTPRRRRF